METRRLGGSASSPLNKVINLIAAILLLVGSVAYYFCWKDIINCPAWLSGIGFFCTAIGLTLSTVWWIKGQSIYILPGIAGATIEFIFKILLRVGSLGVIIFTFVFAIIGMESKVGTGSSIYLMTYASLLILWCILSFILRKDGTDINEKIAKAAAKK